MCDLEPDFLIAEFKKAAKAFKPAEILRWNGMSWDYLSIALSLPEDSISKGDRADLVKFACNAVAAAAWFELGLGAIPKIFKWRRRDRSNSLIEAMASIKMPPEPGPTGYGEHDGVEEAAEVPEDTHRVQRRRAIAAALLLRIEKDPDWRPTPAEFEEIARRAGARVRTPAA